LSTTLGGELSLVVYDGKTPTLAAARDRFGVKPEMAHGVESRPPFLDHVLADFASTLPMDLLVHLDGQNVPVEKWLFR
jgi:asparagine synthetase B (glutamine-hydrolysing)